MPPTDREVLMSLARRYVWWKSPGEALQHPRRVIAQVMNLGDWDDVEAMRAHVRDAALRDALVQAEAGQLNARSWTFWHYRLGVARPGEVPPLPVRHFR